MLRLWTDWGAVGLRIVRSENVFGLAKHVPAHSKTTMIILTQVAGQARLLDLLQPEFRGNQLEFRLTAGY